MEYKQFTDLSLQLNVLTVKTKSNTKMSSYNDTFEEQGCAEVRLGKASTDDLLLSLLRQLEGFETAVVVSSKPDFEGHQPLFEQTIFGDLKGHYVELKKLFKTFGEFYDQPYMELFKFGPRKFENKAPQNIKLPEVKLQKLAETFVNRFDYGTRRLFRKNEPREWASNDVHYNGLASADLVVFAEAILHFWEIFDEKFAEAFGLAIKHAVDVTKAAAEAYRVDHPKVKYEPRVKKPAKEPKIVLEGDEALKEKVERPKKAPTMFGAAPVANPWVERKKQHDAQHFEQIDTTDDVAAVADAAVDPDWKTTGNRKGKGKGKGKAQVNEQHNDLVEFEMTTANGEKVVVRGRPIHQGHQGHQGHQQHNRDERHGGPNRPRGQRGQGQQPHGLGQEA